MKKFEEKKFDIPELIGISKKTIEEHLKLYGGYVKNANLILEQLGELAKVNDPETPEGQANIYKMGELQRRFAFEFGGMRNHEYYFSAFKSEPKKIDVTGPVYGGIEEEFGTFEEWLGQFKKMAGSTRGIGWMMLYHDPHSNRFFNQWVDEQHLNHLASCTLILALDMWEHSYVADYQPSGKKQYIEDFFANLNWEVIDENFFQAVGER